LLKKFLLQPLLLLLPVVLKALLPLLLPVLLLLPLAQNLLPVQNLQAMQKQNQQNNF
jgi:hypothetical protein